MRVDELRIVGGGFSLDVTIFEGDDDVEANIVLLVSLPLGKLELFDVVHHFPCPNQLGELEDLVDGIVAHQERSLLKDLHHIFFTNPARIIPADQQSTR